MLSTTNVSQYIADVAEPKLLSEIEDIYAKGSGWTLTKVLSLQLNINRYVPLRG